MTVIYFLWLIVLALAMLCNCKNITFYGKSRSLKEFKQLKSDIDCMLTEGEWVKHKQTIFTHPCTLNSLTTGVCNATDPNLPHRNGLDYSWRTKKDKCNEITRPFSRKRLCKNLNKKNVLFVGDSINDHFYLSFMSALHNVDALGKCHVVVMAQHGEPVLSPCFEGTVASVRELSFSIDEEELVYVADDKQHHIIPRWFKLLGTHKIDLIVANRGLHWHPTDVVIDKLNSTFHYLNKFHPNVSVIYRSTSTGHQNCTHYFDDAPVKEQIPFHAVSWNPNTPKGLGTSMGFHWQEIGTQNEQVKRFIVEQHPSVLYMDIYPAVVLRPDSHNVKFNDCLHYCMPGPIDQWVIALDNVLGLLRRR